MKQIFLDVETKKTFDDVGGYYPDKLEASFVGLIERTGFPEEVNQQEVRYELFESDFYRLPSLLEHADVVIGFNITGFDLPALQPIYPGDILRLPQLDLLEVIKNVSGHRVSLNAVAKETLGTEKLAHGLDAITYYQNKEFDKLAKYCMKDVEITRDIYDYGRVHKKIKFMNKWNNVVELGVDFSFTPKADQGLQMTLI